MNKNEYATKEDIKNVLRAIALMFQTPQTIEHQAKLKEMFFRIYKQYEETK